MNTGKRVSRIISALIACVLMSSAALIAVTPLGRYYKENYKSIYVCTRKKTYLADGIARSHEYAYDDMGNLISDKCYNKDGVLTDTNEVIYGDTCAIKELKRYNSRGEVYQWYKKVYDYAERKLTETTYNVMGPGYSKSERTYDDKYIVPDKKQSVNELNFEREYTYDSRGNMLTSKEIGDNYIGLGTYDASGKLLSFKGCDSNGTVKQLTEYGYDKHGNILSISRYTDGELKSRTEYEYKRMIIPCENGVDTSFIDILKEDWTVWAV